jgi:hypothetical protein
MREFEQAADEESQTMFLGRDGGDSSSIYHCGADADSAG